MEFPDWSNSNRLSEPPVPLVGGPLKPGFGLSGDVSLSGNLNSSEAVQQPHRVYLRLDLDFVPSIPTRSPRALQHQLPNGESCSTANPPDARISLPSLDSDGCSEVSPQTAGSREC